MNEDQKLQHNFERKINELTKPIDNYDSDLMKLFLEEWTKKRIDLFLEKDESYGGSWQSDGILGAFFNLKRKIDRIVTLFKTGKMFGKTNKDSTGETILDTFMDLENYSGMNVGLLFFKSNKERFDVFLNLVPTLKEFFEFDVKNNKVVKLKTDDNG